MTTTLSIDELRRQAKLFGYRLEPITKLDMDREAFASCVTRKDVEVVLASMSGLIDPRAIPSMQELEQRRKAVTELQAAGVDPFQPAKPIQELKSFSIDIDKEFNAADFRDATQFPAGGIRGSLDPVEHVRTGTIEIDSNRERIATGHDIVDHNGEIFGMVVGFVADSNGKLLIVASRVRPVDACPVCFHRFEMGQPPDFKAEDGGRGHDGERAIHWHSGTQTCPECGSTWQSWDSD